MSKTKKKKPRQPSLIDCDLYELFLSLNNYRQHLKNLLADLKSGKIKKEKLQQEYYSHVYRLVSFIDAVLPPDQISGEDIDAGNYTVDVSESAVPVISFNEGD